MKRPLHPLRLPVSIALFTLCASALSPAAGLPDHGESRKTDAGLFPLSLRLTDDAADAHHKEPHWPGPLSHVANGANGANTADTTLFPKQVGEAKIEEPEFRKIPEPSTFGAFVVGIGMLCGLNFWRRNRVLHS